MSKKNTHVSQSQSFSRHFQDIRDAIEQLHIPSSVYMGVEIGQRSYTMAELGGDDIYVHNTVHTSEPNLSSSMLRFIRQHAIQRNVKYVAASLSGNTLTDHFYSNLWLQDDIVPLLPHGKDRASTPSSLASFTSRHFDGNICTVDLSTHNEVLPHRLVDLDTYARSCDKETFDSLLHLCDSFRGKSISFISATPQGGGVALMRHALLRLLQLLKVDCHWYVLEPRSEAFEITKEKFHNVLQSASIAQLSVKDKEIYLAWMHENAVILRPVIQASDVIVIDDPQPSGLIPLIKKIKPSVYCIYRSHIHMDTERMKTPSSPQSKTWDFLWSFISQADLFVSHPLPSFVPPHVPFDKVVFMPATTDLFDGLNKTLSPTQLSYYRKLFDKYLLETGQTPLDSTRPFLVQIARFDPSKGISDVLEAYRMFRQSHGHISPQLVLAGHGSIDDPDGAPLFHLTLDTIRSSRFSGLTNDIKVALLPHIDQVLNMLLRESYAVLQLSHQDGFEVKVTEALMKGKPVIAYKTGGIQLQILNGSNGLLVSPVGNVEGVSKSLHNLFDHTRLYSSYCRSATSHYRKDVDTVHNAINWLYLANHLVEKGSLVSNGMDIRTLLSNTYPSFQYV